MLHQMRYSVLTMALACVVLFRITPGGSLAAGGATARDDVVL